MIRPPVPSLLASCLLLGCSPPTTSGDEQPADGKVDKADKQAEADPVASKPAKPVELEPIAPPGQHPFSVLDLLEVDRVSSPALSPDGTLVAYVLRETDMKANQGRTSLWLQALDDPDSSGPTQIDADPKGASQPQWSPDGNHLYFVSSRSGSSQVFRRAIAGGKPVGDAEQITDLPVAVSNLVLAPDGQHLAVSAELFPDCPELACTVERSAAIDSRSGADATTGVVYDRLFVRHWDTWKDGRRSALLVAATTPGTKTATIVSAGLDADVPSKPFGGSEEFRFSPDSQGIVFTARTAGGGEPWSTNFDLYYAPISASNAGKAPVQLTHNPAWDTHPRFSPDGKQLTYLAMARPGYEADRFVLTTLNWTGGAALVEGEPRAVTGGWDRSISTFEYGREQVFATAQDLGHKRLFAIDPASGQPAALAPSGTVGGIAVGDTQLVFTRHDLRHPAELHSLALTRDAEPQRLSHHNDALMARVDVGEPEQFEFPGWNGETVYGWVVKPVDFDPSKTYPVAFVIHGGPQGSFGDQFHFRWNPQTYAGAGYATVMIDFHGSTGYGQAFTDSIAGDWGGKPLEDLQKGLAFALERYPWLANDKICALGASYGGYMINWIAGRWPERFNCLVNHDGIFDERMMYYATEELWFPEWEHAGPEFDDPAAYARFNPVDHVGNWQTPMLVVHGSLDYRVPIEQGLATFTALQRRGIPSRFLHFPDENHWVMSPANSKQWHDEVLRWLAEYL